MASPDVAPTFGAELKVGLQSALSATLLVREVPHRCANLAGSVGWFQTRQRLGGWRHRVARRHPIILPRAECYRKGIQCQAHCAGEEVL